MTSYHNAPASFTTLAEISKQGGKPLYRQAYISNLNSALTVEELEILEKISTERSKRFGIRNLLVIVDDQVIQIMEGPERTVRRMMKRIMKDVVYHHGANLFCCESISTPALRGPNVMVKRTYNAPEDVQNELRSYVREFFLCQTPCSLEPATIGFLNSLATYTFDRELDAKADNHYFKTAS